MAEFWWKSTDDAYSEADEERGFNKSRPVDEQHPLPLQLMQRESDTDEWTPANLLLAGVPVVVHSQVWVSQQVRAPYGATSAAFDANDAVGDVMRFDKDGNGDPLPKRGRILSAICIDQADQASLLTAHVFAGGFTGAASDAAYTASVADMAKWVANIVFTVMNDEGSARGGQVPEIDTEYYSPEGFLDVQFSTTGTPTMAADTMPLLRLFILPLDN